MQIFKMLSFFIWIKNKIYYVIILTTACGVAAKCIYLVVLECDLSILKDFTTTRHLSSCPLGYKNCDFFLK